MATIYGQAYRALAVTPSSNNDLGRHARGVYVTGAGNLVVTLAGDEDGTFVTFASHACQYHPIEVKRIWAESTATGIIALYHD